MTQSMNETINITTTEDYDYYDYVDTTVPETIIGEIYELSEKERTLLEVLLYMTVLTFFLFVVMTCILRSLKKRDMDSYLMLNHTIIGLLHQTCVTISFIFYEDKQYIQFPLKQVENYLSLSTPFWTMCLAIKAFTNLVLMRNVYSTKEFMAFCYSSVTLLQITEDVLLYVLSDLTTHEGANAVAALRMTNVSLVMSVSVSITLLILFYFIKEPETYTNKSYVILILTNIIVLTLFDSLIVAFAVVSTSKNTTLKLVMALALCARMVLEVNWSFAFDKLKIKSQQIII